MAVNVLLRLGFLVWLASCSATRSPGGRQLTAHRTVDNTSGPEDEPTDVAHPSSEEDEPETESPTCGVPAIQPNVDLTRVVGGQEATKHSWPWMVSLQVSGDHHFCGGSLINKQWVMSAAHCGRGLEAYGLQDEVSILLGSHKKSEPDSQVIRVNVSRMFINEKYDYGDTGLSNDVMLMKLAHPVEFNDFISPVCLPTPFKAVAPGTQCYLTGWGTMWFLGPDADELMQVKLEIIHRDVCNKPEWYDGMIADSMVCAGYTQGGVGGCHGDSGGPLVCLDDGRWVQYGVVSGAIKCGNPHKPEFFARVSAYRRWIDTKIRENSD